jgi:hypothetical protein
MSTRSPDAEIEEAADGIRRRLSARGARRNHRCLPHAYLGDHVISHATRSDLLLLYGSCEVGELLGGITLDQEVPVVQGFEVDLDDICTGVVDPHVLDSNHHY